MNVTWLCCHVPREMRVCDVMLQNAVLWQHGCCRSLVLGGSLGRKPCVFSGKVALASDERYFVSAAGAGLYVLTCVGSSVFCNDLCVVCT